MVAAVLPKEARAWRAVSLGLVAAKLAVHLSVLGRWDYHRDEFYFVMCARRLAAGYVDHPPMIAWLTALVGSPFGYDLRALRVVPALAAAVTMALTCLLVRALGGGARAALLAGACVLVGPVFLRSGSLLCIPALEPALWSGAALVVVKLSRGGSPRLWLVLGAVVGAGLLTKHSMGLWALGLATGVLFTPLRAALRTRWPWLGLALAALLFAPNVWWQMQHDFATVEFLRTMSTSVLSKVPRWLFLAGIALYLNPLTIPVWGAGLLAALRPPDRALGVAFLLTLGVLLLTHAKPYYIAGAFPALFAAGGVAIERWSRASRPSLPAYAAVGLLVTAPPLALVALPIVAVDAVDRGLEPVVGFATAPMNLTGELHDQHGWREHAAAVTRAARTLSDEDRARAVVLAANYGQAGAIEVLARGAARAIEAPGVVPPVASGHMNYHLWGLPAGRGDVAIAIGFEASELGALFADVREVTRSVDAPLAWPRERALPVFICREPTRPLRDAWPELRRYHHVGLL